MSNQVLFISFFRALIDRKHIIIIPLWAYGGTCVYECVRNVKLLASYSFNASSICGAFSNCIAI